MTTPHPLIGTWKLLSQETHRPGQPPEHTRGLDPDGLLIYTPDGYMSVQLARTDSDAEHFYDRTDFDHVMSGYHAYFGRYEIDEAAGIVRHHVQNSLYPPYAGQVQVRHYQLAGDRLTLNTPPWKDGSWRVLVWERAKA
jgi:hypothetical protein